MKLRTFRFLLLLSFLVKMANLIGVTSVSDLNSGTIIDTEFDGTSSAVHRLRFLQTDADEDDEPQEVIRERVTLDNVLTDISAAPEAPEKGNLLIKPPLDAFGGIGKKMEPVTPDGGLVKLITVTGYADTVVNDTDYVTFNYSGWLDGSKEPFTSSFFARKPVDRQIGSQGPAFIGLDLALQSMKKGEVAFFMSCPAFSYGRNGTRREEHWPEIKGDQWLLWKIEVVNIIADADHVTDIFSLSPEERSKLPFSEVLAAVNTQMEMGAEAFKFNRYKTASKSYGKAAKLLVESRILSEQEALTKKTLTSKAFCNLAVCSFKLEDQLPEQDRDYDDVVANAEYAVKFNESNVRAWYWGGRALRLKKKLEMAREYLTKAHRLEPNNSEIGGELRALEKDLRDDKVEEQKILRKMVGVNNEGKVVNKIPTSVENSVSESFRQLIKKELDDVLNGSEDLVQFDKNLYSKSEMDYVNAAVNCCDQAKISVRNFPVPELGTEMIEVQRS